MEIPDPCYVKTEDGAYIAYQVVGDGPVDIAWQFGHLGNIDLAWGLPWESTWFEGLASFARVILHDQRATGLSSRNVAPPNLEMRAADLRAVLDAAGSQSAVLGGKAGSMCPCCCLPVAIPIGSAHWCGGIHCRALSTRPTTRGHRARTRRLTSWRGSRTGVRSGTRRSWAEGFHSRIVSMPSERRCVRWQGQPADLYVPTSPPS